MLMSWLPGAADLRHYRRAWLRGDVIAGLTVSAYLIPQVMAYATLAGLPPVAGLWAALAPMAVYAIVGSSSQLSVGPESTTALMTAAALAPLAIGDPSRYAVLAAALAVLVGIVCLLAGVCRLGFLAEMLSRPVLIGYMTGVAVVMIGSQLGKVTGVEVDGEEFIPQIRSFAAHIGEVNWPTLAMSVTVLVLLFVLFRRFPGSPGALLAVLAATAAVWLLDLDRHGITVIGEIPAGFGTLGAPAVSAADLLSLCVPALGIAVVAFSDNVLTARTFGSRKNETIDPNAELRALGVCNLATGVTQGFPVSSSGSRTALGDAAGSRTQLYSLVMLAVVVAVLMLGGDLLAGFPTAALGALVVYAALKLVDIDGFRRLARFRRSELILAVSTTVAVLGIGMLYGVLVAIALSALDTLRRIARPHDGVLGYVPGLPGMHDIDDYPQAEEVPGLVVYRYDAPLFFANAENFRLRAMAAVEQARYRVEWFVYNAEANVDPDLTAIDALEQLRTDLTRRGIVFAMARVKQDLLDDLVASGFYDELGPNRIFPTLPTAVQAFRDRATG
ncbi:sulfate permease [Mycobacterium sp. MBM]|nr:sulfate permease [Mycobacterium sp. MBM]